MSRARWAALALALAGCGSSAGQSADGGAKAVDAAAAADLPPVTPPAKTCGARVSPVDTSTADHVVGAGDAGSCTAEVLAAAVAQGGKITFACGDAPVTIAVTTTIDLPTDRDTTIDGGG